MSNDVRIVTDSASDLDPNDPLTASITVVPLKIRFDTEEFTDGVELTRSDFWGRMATTEELPATSAPAPGAFETAFSSAAAAGVKEIVCLSISGKISATHQIAASAAAGFDTIPVHVVDTSSCALAQSTLCAEAARLAQSGASAKEIVAEIEDLKTRVHLYATLDTLENLKKGGRIGTAGAFFGTLLSIKPIVGLVNGEVKAVGKARTRTKAMDQLIEMITSQGAVEHLKIGHTYAPDIEEFVQKVKVATGQNEIPVSIVGPVVGTHTGPRLLAVSFVQPKKAQATV